MKKLESIDTLLNRAIKLSKDPKKNALELAKLRKQIILQKETIDKIDTKKIAKKINTLDSSECKRYRDILNEKKRYDEKKTIINRVINEDYSVLNAHRKRKKAKFYRIIISSALVISLSSCAINGIKNRNNKTTEIETTTEEDTYYNWDFDDSSVTTESSNDNTNTTSTTEKITTEKITTEKITTEEITTETTTTEEIITSNTENDYSSNENWGFDNLNTDTIKDSVDFFNNASKYIDNMEETITNPDKREEVKNNAKEKAIAYIDFIFYGKAIDGVYFDDLKSDAKEKAYKNCQKLVQLVNKYDPEYFDNMGERYSRFKDLASLTLDNAKAKLKEKVGEDYYNNAGQVKDDTIDSIKDTGKILKNVISDKYNEWKNKGN